MTWIAAALLALLVAGAGFALLRSYLHMRSLDDETRGEIEAMQVRIHKQHMQDMRMDPRNRLDRFGGYGD